MSPSTVHGRLRRERLDPTLRRIGLVTILGSVMSVLDTMVVNVALDSLSRKLHTDIETIQWVVTSYLLALAATVPISAWAARRIGVKKLYLISLLIFTVGSALCGLAWSAGSLIVFRVLQGIGGGMIVPVGQMIIVRAAGKDNLGRVMGVLSTPTILAPIFGPTIGGLLLQAFGWQWIFLINIPVGVVALILGQRILPPDQPEAAGRLDVPGFVLAGLGTVALIYGLAETASKGDLMRVGSGGAVLAGAILLVAFVRESLRSSAPLLDLTVFRDRTYTAVTITALMSSAAMFSAMIITPLYFQIVRGQDATRTALLVAPVSIGVVLVISRAGRASDRYGGGRVSVIGLVVGALSLLPFIVFDEHTPYIVTILVNIMRGIGFGALGTPLFAVAFAALGEKHTRDVSAQMNIVMRVGGSLGTAIATVILQRALSHHGGTPAQSAIAFQETYVWLTAISVVAIVPAARLWIIERRTGLRRLESASALEVVEAKVESA
ncbi:MAG TPA: MDR family MFS transporter [Frankiaceae bacterium]|nr:MDR family MFS transporter [Frankiaceae bacterium]